MYTKEEKKQQVKTVIGTAAYLGVCVGLTILGVKVQKKWIRDAVREGIAQKTE